MFGRRTTTPWFYETTVFTEALSRLLYLVDVGEALALVHGPDGSGRTSLLKKLQEQLQRRQAGVVLLNAAALDAESLLWHLADALAIVSPASQRRSEILLKIRDELLGRAHCGLRSAILLDDIQRAAPDVPSLIHQLAALGTQQPGMLTVVATSQSSRVPGLADHPALNIALSLLSPEESLNFVINLLSCQRTGLDRVESSAVTAVAELAGGSPAQLLRLCDLVEVVTETSPDLRIDGQVVREIAQEVLPRAVA